jgi:hypothetical protein
MTANNKLAALTAALAMLCAPMFGAIADAKPKIKTHHRHFAHRPTYPAERRTAGGELLGGNGWRHRDGTSDNTCFHLNYLPSQFACSPNGGGM